MTANQLRAWRLRLDLTQAQAAEQLGMGLRTYIYLEQGERRITEAVRLATLWLEERRPD